MRSGLTTQERIYSPAPIHLVGSVARLQPADDLSDFGVSHRGFLRGHDPRIPSRIGKRTDILIATGRLGHSRLVSPICLVSGVAP